MSRIELMGTLALADRYHFAAAYLRPALEVGLVQMTISDRPRSREQRYRLTEFGEQFRESGHQPDAG